MELYGLVLADSFTLRRLSANAVRFRLGAQLDWRIDLLLDAEGMHLLRMRGIYVLSPNRQVEWLMEPLNESEGTFTDLKDPSIEGEMVVRSEALLKIPGTMEPLEMPLDLRLRDYTSLKPAKPTEQRTYKSVQGRLTMGSLIPDDHTPNILAASKKLRELN